MTVRESIVVMFYPQVTFQHRYARTYTSSSQARHDEVRHCLEMQIQNMAS